MTDYVEKLRGGDRRSIGRADEVAREIQTDAEGFDIVVDAITADDPVVRMRAADAVEKASENRPELLAPHRDRMLSDTAAIDQQEVRWHVAQMLPRLDLDDAETDRAVERLETWLSSESRIVQVSAMQALADLAATTPRLRDRARSRIRAAVEDGSPAVKARGRKLLADLEGGE